VYYAGYGRTDDAIREFAKVVELTDRELRERTMAPEDLDFHASSIPDRGMACSLAKDFQLAILSFQLAAQANLAMADGMMERLRARFRLQPRLAPM
jgi:hypothetical protein